MTEREKLIELLNEATFGVNVHTLADHLKKETIEAVADHLLSNGVIVPPCKVGDKVYVIEDWGYKKELKEKEIGVIAIKGVNDFSKELWEDAYGGSIGDFADFGKTVFLTKEEAERALKEKQR